MTRWWWVRHGPTHQKAFTGWRDVPADLSDTAQIAQLIDHLPQAAVLISSDLQRASATADAIQTTHRRLAHEPRLRELHFGVWDGMMFEQVAARDPELSRAYWEAPGDIRAPEGESWNDAAARAAQVVDALNKEGHSDIIAVAHFGIILTQLQRASGKTVYDTLAQPIDPLSVTELHHDAGQWKVASVNHVP